jgi:hypothetical protein
MGFHPPCAIGSKDNSSLAFNLVSKPSNVLISRPDTIISALGRGSIVSRSRTNCVNSLKSGREAISAIADRTVG